MRVRRASFGSVRREVSRESPAWEAFYAVQGWFAVAASAVAGPLFAALPWGIASEPHSRSDLLAAAAVGAVFALPCLVTLNAAALFARLRRASPERYAAETRGRGFVRHLGWCGRSIGTELHASVVRLAAGGADLPRGLRAHVRATLWLHRAALASVVTFAVALLVALVARR